MCLQKVLCQTCSTYILLSSYLNFCICKQKGRRIIKIESTLSKELGHLYICTSPPAPSQTIYFLVTLAQNYMYIVLVSSQVSHYLGLKKFFYHFI